MEQKLLTVSEVAKRLRLTTASVTGYLRAGELRGAKMARVWRVEEEDLRIFLEGRMNI